MKYEEAIGHVRSVFAQELAAIQDEDLRDKVVRAWARVMTISGAKDLSKDLGFHPELTAPGIGLEHVRGVVRMSIAIADDLRSVHHSVLNRDVIVAGALLHDVGKLVEHERVEGNVLTGPMVPHAFSGVAIAAQEGIPSEVLHCIAFHSIEGQRARRTAECEVVYRADEIDADALYRRDLGYGRSERVPYVFLPRVKA